MKKLEVTTEVEAKIREVFDVPKESEGKSSSSAKVEISRPSEDSLKIEVQRMYSYVDCSFAKLKQLSDFFGTDEIDLNNWASNGCDTCDFGSCYTVEVDIKKITR